MDYKEDNKSGSPLDGGVLDPQPLEPLQNPGKPKTFGSILARTITGIAFVVMIVLCLQNPMAYLILFAALTGLMTWEFCTLVNSNLHLQVNALITTLMSTYFFFAVFDAATGLTGSGYKTFIPVVISVMYLLVSELYLKGFRKIENWAFAFMAFVYMAVPMSMLHAMAFIGIQSGLAYVSVLNLAAFVFLWSSDTGAYLIGSKFGKRRLFPSISPKKSPSWASTERFTYPVPFTASAVSEQFLQAVPSSRVPDPWHSEQIDMIPIRSSLAYFCVSVNLISSSSVKK
ncbi:MAG: phosphatidate cytidylyltransferase [Oscillospiraceae bacterium]|nr:phosphatidate cytidylyltransferase [Oscillospiraceae bacterium]